MADIRDLVQITQNTYQRLTDPTGSKDLKISGNLDFVGYAKDARSDHGGIAYYDKAKKEVVIGNRGSATARDWLVTDPQIVLGVRETLADIAAKRFADKVINDLDRKNQKIETITCVGHSLGGHQSQMVLAHLTDIAIPNVECQSVTFNSLGVHKSLKQENTEYNHVNLQVTGNGKIAFASTDLVSEIRTQLGQNFNVPLNVGNPISAHKMTTAAKMLDEYPETSKLTAKEMLKLIQQGMNIKTIEQHQNKNQVYAGNQTLQTTVATAPLSNVTLIPATPGLHTGNIISENKTQIFQQLENSQKYVIVHEKDKLDHIPKVGEKVSIRHNANSQIKSKVEKVEANENTKTRGR